MSETHQAARNKELLQRSFAEFAGGNVEILRGLLKEDFIEHSPGNPSGRDAFMRFLAESPVATAKLELKRVIADDDHVVMHYQMTRPGAERGVAVVDIWRVADGQIAEHWDVVQPVPEAAQLPHGMF